MTDLVTVTGFVGNDPRCNVTGSGLPITNFRLASTRRYFDRNKGEWVDGETNWYSVAAFRQLGLNVAESVSKGDRVIVHGRLRLRQWDTGEKSGLAVEIEADAIGHDLSWATTTAARTTPARTADAGEPSTEADAEVGAESTDAWARPGSTGWPGGDDVSARAGKEAAQLESADDPTDVEVERAVPA